MLPIVGIIVVIASDLTGFSMAGGHMHSLIHPSEIVTIGGAALGAMICSSPPKVLKDVMKGLIMEFVSGTLQGAMEGNDGPTLQALLDTEIHVFESEHHDAVSALTRTADGLPGFGIVAAVLGIVVTMGAIGGPVEEIGHKVGAALVGTFLGILMSYGLVGPLAGAMDGLGHAEAALQKTIAAAIVGFASGGSPRAVMDNVRRGCGTAVRPSSKELDEMLQEVDAQK